MKHKFGKSFLLFIFVMAAYFLGMFSMTISDDNTRLIYSMVVGLSIGIICAIFTYKQFK